MARNSQLVASTISGLGEGSRLMRAGSFIANTYDATRALSRQAADYGTLRAVRASADLSDAASRRILDPARTAVQRYEVAEQTRRLSPNYLESLSPAESSRLGRFFARYGDNGGRLMADGGEDLRDLIVRSDGLDEDTTQALLRAHARGDLNDAALRRTARYLDEGRMDQADVRRMEEMLRTRGSGNW